MPSASRNGHRKRPRADAVDKAAIGSWLWLIEAMEVIGGVGGCHAIWRVAYTRQDAEFIAARLRHAWETGGRRYLGVRTIWKLLSARASAEWPLVVVDMAVSVTCPQCEHKTTHAAGSAIHCEGCELIAGDDGRWKKRWKVEAKA